MRTGHLKFKQLKHEIQCHKVLYEIGKNVYICYLSVHKTLCNIINHSFNRRNFPIEEKISLINLVSKTSQLLI